MFDCIIVKQNVFTYVFNVTNQHLTGIQL